MLRIAAGGAPHDWGRIRRANSAGERHAPTGLMVSQQAESRPGSRASDEAATRGMTLAPFNPREQALCGLPTRDQQLPFRTLGRHPQMAAELDERARAEAVKGSGIGRSIGTRLVIRSSSCTR